ncbi:hypothetical protein [Argonema antarcticum]|uniref:hypothetical protein n=1 Tax=Argonema antarcticum TaxID=2942763 RepID=UPI0020132195|nr:hypothetical protein [Argonema antarcticum]MCL1474298.1 hypothetical protein [Argonema antarcticum A004/B2]
MIQKILDRNYVLSSSLGNFFKNHSQKEKNSKKQLVFKCFGAILSALVVWELILENTMEKSPGSITHPVLGKIAKPGINVQGEEGFSKTKINDLGMRGENILPKPKNKYRILAFGDSYTRALQVADNKTYSYLLQEALKNKYKFDIETINAGRDGASPAYYIHLASFYNSLIEPNSVIIQVTDQDFTEDILNKNKEFYVAKDGNSWQTKKNETSLSDDALSQIFLVKFPQLRFMLEYSVLRVGGKNLQKLLGTKENKLSLPGADSSQKKKSPDLSRYDAVIDWTVENIKNKYPKVVILYLPDYNNVNQSSSQIENALNKYTAKHKVDFVNMREDFINYYQINRQRVHGFNNTVPGTGHVNEVGNSLTAERLAVIFETRILK